MSKKVWIVDLTKDSETTSRFNYELKSGDQITLK